VKHDELVATVAERAGVSRRHADEIVLATLSALGERLTPDETKDLLAQLPKKYKQQVNAVSNPTPMTADEFVARVAELEGTRAPSPDDARLHVRAVLTTLTDAVNAGEIKDVVAQLGDDFDELLGFAPDASDEAQEAVASAFEELERDVAETFDSMREHLDETLDEVSARPAITATPPDGNGAEPPARAGEAVRGADLTADAAEAGREAARGVVGAVSAVAESTVRVVTGGARSVARTAAAVADTARDKALDAIVLAIDRIEGATDRLDDAAEALQERVHRKVEADRR
jgi:uncharacterized protein (DUF2267 family)